MIVVSADGGYFPPGLMYASLFWSVAFGFFAFGYSDDDDSCTVTTEDDFITKMPNADGEMDGSSDSVDVSERLNLFYLIGFYICAAQVVLGLMTHIVSGYDITRLIYNMYHFS